MILKHFILLYVSGLDIAYISNGYVYHTQHDTIDMIPPGCIQRGGRFGVFVI